MKKPRYSPSRIVNFVRCPYAFFLSQSHDPDFSKNTERLFTYGKIMESHVFGFRDEDGEREADLTKGLHGKTLDRLKANARHILKVFKAPRRNGHVKIVHEVETFVISGELDFVGGINKDRLQEITLADPNEVQALPNKMIIDLKMTGNISRTWDFKGADRSDYLQAAFYPYLHYQATGELLDFAYLIVEDGMDPPIVRFIHLKIDLKVLSFVDRLVRTIDQALYYRPLAAKHVCGSGFNQGVCPFLKNCEHGRKVMGGLETTVFSEITSHYRIPGEEIFDEDES